MKLGTDDMRLLVERRVEKSDSALRDARMLAEMGSWNSAANRLYYAAYHVVTALLLQYGIPTKTDEGVVRMFGLHFVKPGTVNAADGRFYVRLFTIWQTGERDCDYEMTESDVMPYVVEIEPFVSRIKGIIAKDNQEK